MKNIKGLVFGIIILFLGTSITPIAGSLSVEKQSPTIKNLGPEGFIVYLTGTMGKNGWFISPHIGIKVIATNGSKVTAVYYSLDGGAWMLYTGPWINIFYDCTIHYLKVCVYDQYGNPWNFSFEFKIDMTTPTIVLHKQFMSLNKIKFVADAFGAPSGVWYVEFYLDNQLVYNDTTSPFEWTWTGSGNHMVAAIVYDMAGHSAGSSMSTPCTQSQSKSSPNVQKNSQNMQICQLPQHMITNK